MAANVLNSKHAIEMSILIVRVFAKFRYLFGAHIELAQKIAELENQFKDKTREQTIHINKIYKILDALMVPPPQPKKGHMGFDPGRT